MARMKALDTLHVSSVRPDNILAGEEFDVNDEAAKQLEARGLAKMLGASPRNKMVQEPKNKADKVPLSGGSFKAKDA